MHRIIVLLIFFLSHLMFGQQIQQAEYFWDSDPGPGNGNALTAFDGNFNQALETVFSNDATLPPVGNHVLHVRVKGQDGTWGPAFRKVFRVSSSTNTNLEVKITQAEYFWDNDPGAGNGLALLAFDGNFNQAFETVFSNNATLPTVGDHVLHVRVKGSDGNWSPAFRKAFRVSANTNTNLTVSISHAEYFWNDDPGAGNGLPLLAFDGNFYQAFETLFTNNATLPTEGDHVLNVRVRAQDNLWSPVFRKVFRLVLNNNTNLEVKIVQAEYFWDDDPGAGNGFALIAFDGNFNQALESVFVGNSTLPAEGDHILNVRVKAQDGNWSTPFRKVFRLAPNNNTNFEVKITQGEYFWDVDPGFGNGLPLLAFDGNFDQALETLSNALQITVPSGLHVLHVRTRANDGNWGPTYRKVIGVNVAYDQKVLLQSPFNLATNVPVSPTLLWNQLNQIENYEFEVSLSPSFESFIASGFTTNVTSIDIQNLATNTTYYWRVRANLNGNVSLWSDVWSFTTTNSLNLTEIELIKQIIIHPVPAVKELLIKCSNALTELNYEIYDTRGRSILKGVIDNYKINVESLPEGIYVLSLTTNNNSKFSTQFIKSKQ